MSGARGYGWDQYATEGIAELRRMLDSRAFAPLDGQRHLLETYIDIYSIAAEHQLTGASFYPEDPPCKAAKKASKNVKALKRSVEAYYRHGEGRDSAIAIGFAADARKYGLTIGPHESAPTVPASRVSPGRGAAPTVVGSISFEEKAVWVFSMPSPMWPSLCFVFGLVGVLLVVGALTSAARTMGHQGSIIWTTLLIAGAVFFLIVTRTTYRVHVSNFGSFVGHFFFRRQSKINTLAHYSGTCPHCGGKVHLTSKKRSKGYTGECQVNPIQHRFSFDPSSLTGSVLVP